MYHPNRFHVPPQSECTYGLKSCTPESTMDCTDACNTTPSPVHQTGYRCWAGCWCWTNPGTCGNVYVYKMQWKTNKCISKNMYPVKNRSRKKQMKNNRINCENHKVSLPINEWETTRSTEQWSVVKARTMLSSAYLVKLIGRCAGWVWARLGFCKLYCRMVS